MIRGVALSVRSAGQPVARLVRPLRGALSFGTAAHCDVVLKGRGIEADHLMMIPGAQGVRLAALGDACFTTGGSEMQLAHASERGEIGVGEVTIAYRLLDLENGPADVEAMGITPSSWRVHVPEDPAPRRGGPDATRDVNGPTLAALLTEGVLPSDAGGDDDTLAELRFIEPDALPQTVVGVASSAAAASASTGSSISEPTVNLSEAEIEFTDLEVTRGLPSPAEATLTSQRALQRAWSAPGVSAGEAPGRGDGSDGRMTRMLSASAPGAAPDDARSRHPADPSDRWADAPRTAPAPRTPATGGTPHRPPPRPPAAAGAGGPPRLVGVLRPDTAPPNGLPPDTVPAGPGARVMPRGIIAPARTPEWVTDPLASPRSMQLPWSVSAEDPSTVEPRDVPALDEDEDEDDEASPIRLGFGGFVLSLIRGPQVRGIKDWIVRVLGLSLMCHLGVLGWLATVDVPERPLPWVADDGFRRAVAAYMTHYVPPPEEAPPAEEPPAPPPKRAPQKPVTPPPPEPLIMELPPVSVDDAPEPTPPEDAKRIIGVTKNTFSGRSRLLDDGPKPQAGGPDLAPIGGIGGMGADGLGGVDGLGGLDGREPARPGVSPSALGARKRKVRDDPPARPPVRKASEALQAADGRGIHSALQIRKRRFSACYETALARTGGELATRRVIFHLIIGADGRASSIRLESEGAPFEDAFKQCLRRAIETLDFPRKLSRPASIKYPLTFQRGD